MKSSTDGGAMVEGKSPTADVEPAGSNNDSGRGRLPDDGTSRGSSEDFDWIEYGQFKALGDNCSEMELGYSNLPRETRTHKHGSTDYRIETRSSRWTAYAKACAPRFSEIADTVRGCAIVSAAGAVVSAVLAGGGSLVYPAFKAAFLGCLTAAVGQRANEVSIDLYRTKETACWEGHCG